MHMADALLSPAVGGAMWAGSLGTIIYCAKKLKVKMDEKMIPLMGVLGAFIFAGQMINFTIPMTGSSGHIGGGMLLAILLGPYAAFLVIASVLMVQALFFADGGLLALGANIWNLGIYPCFIGYPLIYRAIVRKNNAPKLITFATILSVVVGLQLGALSVVLETDVFRDNRIASQYISFAHAANTSCCWPDRGICNRGYCYLCKNTET